MALPLATDTVLVDLNMARELLSKWHARFQEGVPGVTVHGTEEALEAFLTEFVGEMRLVGSKCDALAEIMYGVLTPH